MKKITEFLISICVLLLGVLPAFAFFVWIERNMALPWVGTWIGWPWVFLDGGLVGSVLFDLGLIAAFGLLHSLLAGRAPRALYTVVTGLSAVLLMAGWQSTGTILYLLIPSARAASAVSLIIYWGILAFALATLFRAEAPARFVGFVPPSTESRLWTGGLYALVRHPLYTLLFAAWVLTPMMSLDRLVFILGMALYLTFGVRREERRMVRQFGGDYREYQARTPMFLPRLGRKATVGPPH
jgi:protein-S-isoprenylcysteine O-methyltransferase Ste14